MKRLMITSASGDRIVIDPEDGRIIISDNQNSSPRVQYYTMTEKDSGWAQLKEALDLQEKARMLDGS